MAQVLNINGQAKVLNQLDSYDYTAPVAGMYVMDIFVTEVPPSGLQVEFRQNGSLVASSVLPTPAQNQIRLRVIVNAAANDVLRTNLISSSAIDTEKNVIKAILNVQAGPA